MPSTLETSSRKLQCTVSGLLPTFSLIDVATTITESVRVANAGNLVVTTGRGLPAAERDKIFEAFKHADRARRHGSLGLGPSLARAIIERHGGTMDVDATEAGGTVFHVWLPTERMSRMASGYPPAP